MHFDAEEAAGQLRMIVPGLREQLGERGLMLPDASAAVLDAYVRERVALFGPQLLTAADLARTALFALAVSGGHRDIVVREGDDAHTAYRRWCLQTGVDPHGPSRVALLSALHRRFVARWRAECGGGDGERAGGSDGARCVAAACTRDRNRYPGYELARPTEHEDVLAVLLALARETGAAACVETGTYEGFTTEKLARSRWCPAVFTIELSAEFAAAARARFAEHATITVLEGDSGDVLDAEHSRHFAPLGPSLWFLDGHYSMLRTARGVADSPVMRELEYVLGKRRVAGDVVVIDDARTFRGARLDLGMEYPELSAVLNKVCTLLPEAFVDVAHDLIVVRTAELTNRVLPMAASVRSFKNT